MAKPLKFVDTCKAKDTRNVELLTELRGWLLELPIPQTDKKVLQYIWSKTVRFNKPMEWLKHGDYSTHVGAAFAAPPLDGMSRQSLWRSRDRLKRAGLIAESLPRSDDRVMTAPNWEYFRAYFAGRISDEERFADLFDRFAKMVVGTGALRYEEVSMDLQEVLDQAGEFREKARKQREAKRRKKHASELTPMDLIDEIRGRVTDWRPEANAKKMRGQMKHWIKECYDNEDGNPLDLLKQVIDRWGVMAVDGFTGRFGTQKIHRVFSWDTFYANRRYILAYAKGEVTSEDKYEVVDVKVD